MADDALECFEQRMQQEQQEQEQQDGSSGTLVASLVQQLSGALVCTDAGNAETNRRLWDRYAEAWSPQTEFVTKMAGHTARTAKPDQEPPPPPSSTHDDGPHEAAASPRVLGEEWSSVADLEDVLTRYLFPCLRPDAHVAEIGVGGGRCARYVRMRCARLACMDLSSKMLERAKATLLDGGAEAETGAGAAAAALEFVLLDPRAPAAYPARLAGALDVVYAFDVLVHVDLHTMFQVFQGARRLLKQGGRAFFSTANLLTPAGWRRFERQSKYTAAGFYFLCPPMVDRLLVQVGFKVVQRSQVPEDFKELSDADDGPARGNLYEGRDYLVVCVAV